MSYITRFAPSPTGFLHLGHAFSALTAFETARQNKGEMLLRIEDIDHTRCRPEFELSIYEDLSWLGLDWPKPVLRQSERTHSYHLALKALEDKGLIYSDFRTRSADMNAALSAPQDTMPDTDSTPVCALRLSLDAARHYLGPAYSKLHFTETGLGPKGQAGHIMAEPHLKADVILGRKDIGLSYHLCVVIDDAFQGITHIHRGQDLFEATPTQVLLQTLLGLPTPIYCHHPLLLDEQARRLAKRKGSKSLRNYRLEGREAAEIKHMIAAAARSV